MNRDIISSMSASQPPSYTQRLHDLRAVQANFKSILELLKSGYRFDDADAAPALAQLEKAIANLDRETDLLAREWRSP